jgi:4-oxalocrotonate tautomerase
MPFANLKVPAGLVDAAQKEEWVHTITQLYVDAFGEQARSNVMVLIDEVPDGGWGMGDDVLTLAKLTGSES